MKSHQLSAHVHHEDADDEEHNRGGERRTRWVILLATMMMIGELIVGHITGSMALTADGWHMGTHVGALGLTVIAYWYARTRAGNDTFSFGTGKVYALAGYTSGVLLAVVAVLLGVESIEHLMHPEEVVYNEALLVAVIGLVVNGVSALLLSKNHHYGHGHGHGHGNGHGNAHAPGHGNAHGNAHAHGHGHGHGHDHNHDHERDHDHDHERDHERDHGHVHGHGHDHDDHERDHAAKKRTPEAGTLDFNMRAAYIHILADALTSLMAIVALSLGKWAGLWYLDPLTGLVGGAVIIWWAITLCRQASGQLLDVVSSPRHEHVVRSTLEAIDDVRVADLHVWELGPGRRSCIVSVVTATPREVDYYREIVLAALPIAHLTIEIHQCGLPHGDVGADVGDEAQVAHHHEH